MEGAPLTLLEALATGIPVISTRQAIGYDFGPEPPLCLCDATSEDMARAIDKVFSEPASALQRAAEARLVIEQRFDWSVVVDRLVGTYRGEERKAA